MRAHGIADFPNLKPDGATQLPATLGSDLDSNNPVPGRHPRVQEVAS